MTKRRFSSRLASDKITTREYRVLTFAKCITIMIVKLTVKNSLGSSRDYMVWYGMVGMIFGVASMEPCDPY
jgi:hypothetical protein